jgi:purine nucleosidase
MSPQLKSIIDTDPGLDDAIAILLALSIPSLDILGLTTVAGNIGLDITTRNAARLLALMDRPDIPVIPGAAAPLARTARDEKAIHGGDGLGGVSLPEPLAPPLGLSAEDWLAESLQQAPAGSIMLFALGPLTNPARLLRRHPEALDRIGRIIAMGGTIREKGNVGPHSEFNIASDPEAADLVFRSGVPITLVPLDVTRKLRADAAFIARLRTRNTPAATLSADLIQAYFTSGARESRPLHDPCTVLLALEPDLFTLEPMRLAVDLSDGEDAGRLVQREDGALVEVAMGIDASAALERLAEGLGQRSETLA